VEELKDGGVVSFPTETVYGAGANALSEEAAQGIYKAKRRPADNPLIVHVSDMEMLKTVIHPSLVSLLEKYLEGGEGEKGESKGEGELSREEAALLSFKLCQTYWPGPLTILFPRNDNIPFCVTAGLETVAVRMPSHPVARALIRLSGLPLAAPSANISGRPSPTKASHVQSDLDGRIRAIVDGGSCSVGLESTVVSLFSHPPLILRPGGVTLEQLKEQVPTICLFNSSEHKILSETSAPPTPGLKYRHYAPSTPVTLLTFPSSSSNSETERRDVREVIEEEVKKGNKVVIVKTLGTKYHFEEEIAKKVTIHEIKTTTEVAQQIFACLREFDPYYDIIFVESVEEVGVGVAVMNRLKKAASNNILVSST